MKRGHGEGTIEPRGERLYWRIRRSDGTRPRIPVRKGTTAEVALRQMEAFIKRGHETGKLDEMIDRLLETHPRTQRGRLATKKKLTTLCEVGMAFTNGDLLKEFGPVNGLRPMGSHSEHNTTGYNVNTSMQKVYRMRTRETGPAVGNMPMVIFVHQDIAKIMAQVTGSSSTRNHVHHNLSRAFSLAEIPLGLREPGTNPVLKAYRAPKDPDKLFSCLYPPELFALLGNRDIFINRRVLYVLSHYFGWRLGTLRAFDWSGVDWTHGTVSVLHQKGHRRLDAKAGDAHGVPIFFRADPRCVLTVLRAWWERQGRPERGAVVDGARGPDDLYWREGHDEAIVFRRDLKASGITRALLFSDAPNVQRLRFHDGRAGFCTWARRAGKSDVWITERSGHTLTTSMLSRYTRMAQTYADLGYEPFPDVTSAIPELAPKQSIVCADCALRAAATEHQNSWSTTWSTGSELVVNGNLDNADGPKKQANRRIPQHEVPIEVLAPERASGFKSPPSHDAETIEESAATPAESRPARAARKRRVGQQVGQTAGSTAQSQAAATLLEQAAALTRAGAAGAAEALVRAAQGLLAPPPAEPQGGNVVPIGRRPGRSR